MSTPLPRGWHGTTPAELAAAPGGSLGIGPFGSSLKVSDYRSSGVPLVFVRDIRRGHFGGPGTRFISPAKAIELAAHGVRPGDLLLTKMGDPPGDTAVYPANRPLGIITADAIKLTPDPALTTAEFLAQLFRAPAVRGLILGETRGVATQKLSLKRFRTIALPLPPLAEQRRIVDRLGALDAVSRRARVALDAVPPLLETFRKAVLASAFRGALTAAWRADNPAVEPSERRSADPQRLFELPAGWVWAPAQVACGSVRDGTHATPAYIDEGVPLVTSKNLLASGLDFADVKRISEADHRAISLRSKVDPGDVLFAMIGTVGNPVVVGEHPPFSIKNVALFKGNARVLDPWLLCYWLRSPALEAWLSPRLKGSSQRFAPLSLLRAIPVPIPPRGEQRALVDAVQQALAKVDRIGRLLRASAAELGRLDRSILARAFCGKLVCRDPSDEPASDLLDRVRRERLVSVASAAAGGSDRRCSGR
ncbi:MAG: restriction endonuclease subunit S [Byssovorax sp.]